MVNRQETRIFSASGVLIRRIEYGDYDYIVTFLTREYGKISAIAKNAKKSVKRFSGVLELFSGLSIVVRSGRSMLYLHEASLEHPNEKIRRDIIKTAYAGYWSEILVQWLEEEVKQERITHLFEYVLDQLDKGTVAPEVLSILFQLKFLSLSGFAPGLEQCVLCGRNLESIKTTLVAFDIKRGGLLCSRCRPRGSDNLLISKGTAKQLMWVLEGELFDFTRVKFSRSAIVESLRLLETFLPYHLGKEPNSLKFIRKIR